MRRRVVLGITGTIGAGKGSVVEYLCSEHGFLHLSVRDYLTDKLRDMRLEVNRDNMRSVANSIRKEKSPSFIVEQLLEEARISEQDCVVESIRTIGEVSCLRERGAFLFAVDADVEKRYARVVDRGSETDHVTFAKFLEDEKKEMTSRGDHEQNLSACIAEARVVIRNDENREALFEATERALGEVRLSLGAETNPAR